MAPDRIYPAASAPPPPAIYNVNIGSNGNIGDNGKNGKDQRIPPPATYQRRGRRGRNPCCCRLLWFIVIIGFLLGLAVLISWLVVHPKTPQFTLKKIHITGLSGATTGTSSKTTINYEIMAYNPNKRMSFYYSDIHVKVEENSDTIGQGTVACFSQGHRNTTIVNGAIDDVIVTSSTYASIKNRTNVPLYAEVNLKGKVKVGPIKIGNFKIRVECNTYVDLTVTSGSQLKSKSPCKVHW